ncbi:hypothetical protein BDV59DRAFT_172135 [Aspergillus ambiguus]|uniref:uncharacterized protein n=1 Tax=Aspergillus ambiguus TaxID=176160 RepID=UPI003CCDBC2A
MLQSRLRMWVRADLDMVMFSHHTIKSRADVLHDIYKSWKSAVETIAGIEGLYPKFVMNVLPRGAARMGKTNGIGNVWGLDDDQSWISKWDQIVLNPS